MNAQVIITIISSIGGSTGLFAFIAFYRLNQNEKKNTVDEGGINNLRQIMSELRTSRDELKENQEALQKEQRELKKRVRTLEELLGVKENLIEELEKEIFNYDEALVCVNKCTIPEHLCPILTKHKELKK